MKNNEAKEEIEKGPQRITDLGLEWLSSPKKNAPPELRKADVSSAE
jgi:hypothetical protein